MPLLKFDLNLLSKYRTQLMGVATIMVILCHAPNYGVEMSGSSRKILGFGGIGGDIFLLLSGIGCYYSLSKGFTIKEWYKKRFVRIFVPYTLMQIPFRGYRLFVGNFEFKKEVLIFFTIDFWTQHVGAWYVALLLPLYILTPLFINS